jgi:hypothetical protein
MKRLQQTEEGITIEGKKSKSRLNDVKSNGQLQEEMMQEAMRNSNYV